MPNLYDSSRLFARIALGIAFTTAVVIPIFALVIRGADKPETWTVAAAALAVITSVISTWSSRRVLELQEDAQRPNPIPTLDMTSRYGLTLLRVKNTGAATAHNVSLEWDIDLFDHHKKKIGFFKNGDAPGIAVLLSGESISQVINVHHEFIGNLPDSEFTGRVLFQDASERQYSKSFRLDGRQYAGSPSHDDEWPKTHFEIQKIPAELKQIRQSLQKISDSSRQA